MQKQLRIITQQKLTLAPFNKCFLPLPTLPAIVFSKHLGRLPIYSLCASGNKIYHLQTIHWFIMVTPSGRRLLSALPF